MSLWGASDAEESKPKNLTAAEKLNTYANELGWVKKTTGTGGRAGSCLLYTSPSPRD